MNNIYYDLQPDWDVSTKNADKRIWYHSIVTDSINFNTLVHDNEKSCYLSDVNDEFNIVSNNISYFQPKSNPFQRSTFQSPSSIISNVFEIERQPQFHVTSYDVNSSGELSIASSSKNDVIIFESYSGLVRRKLSPTNFETTKVKFFPSGLVAMTAGLDMQLKVWCCITSTLAATLKPGKAGSLISNSSCDLNIEPGGHTTAVVDFDFIGLGRNVVSVDRCGYIRFWDIPTSSCYQRIDLAKNSSFTSSINGTFASCIACSQPHVDYIPKFPDTDIETVPILETSTSVEHFDLGHRLIGIGTIKGLFLIDPLSKTNSNSSTAFILKSDLQDDYSIKSLCFTQYLNIPKRDVSPSININSNSSTESDLHDESGHLSPTTNSIEETLLISNPEFIVASGSQLGRINVWDLRNPRDPIDHLKIFKWPVLDRIHSPLKLGLISGSNKGRIIVKNIDSFEGTSENSLQLSGIYCERISGISLVPMPTKNYPISLRNSIGVWTGCNRGVFRHYDRLAVDTAFIETYNN